MSSPSRSRVAAGGETTGRTVVRYAHACAAARGTLPEPDLARSSTHRTPEFVHLRIPPAWCSASSRRRACRHGAGATPGHRCRGPPSRRATAAARGGGAPGERRQSGSPQEHPDDHAQHHAGEYGRARTISPVGRRLSRVSGTIAPASTLTGPAPAPRSRSPLAIASPARRRATPAASASGSPCARLAARTEAWVQPEPCAAPSGCRGPARRTGSLISGVRTRSSATLR